jgi:hypothetical protein
MTLRSGTEHQSGVRPDATFITGCTLSVDGGGSFFA